MPQSEMQQYYNIYINVLPLKLSLSLNVLLTVYFVDVCLNNILFKEQLLKMWESMSIVICGNVIFAELYALFHECCYSVIKKAKLFLHFLLKFYTTS